MDPELASIGVQLVEVTGRNLVANVTDRIRVAKERRDDKQTIEVLDEIVNELLADKSELVRIAQAYEQELVAQRISTGDIEYLTTNLVPVFRQLIEASTASGGGQVSPEQILDLLSSVLSAETVTILQLIGFNFKRAIGEPLTDLVGKQISSRGALSERQAEIRALELQYEIATMGVLRDADAFARLQALRASRSGN